MVDDYGPITPDELRELVARLPDPDGPVAHRTERVFRRPSVARARAAGFVGATMNTDVVAFELVDCELKGHRWREWRTRDPRVVR